MKYAILIKPDDTIEIKEYKNYRTINQLVGGWYEICGHFGASNVMCFIFCNEEFLFDDDAKFNAVATLLAGQPIYGNIVILEDGYNPEICDRDSMPLSVEQAHNVQAALSALVSHFSASLKEFHFKYDNSKPEPKYQVDAYFMEDKK